jgi:hypothetical protein
MELGFNIYRRLESGEVFYISWRPNLERAEQCVLALNEQWPGDYGIEKATQQHICSLAYVEPDYRWLN